MGVGKYLDLSTHHVTLSDMELLDAAAHEGSSDYYTLPVIAEYGDGVIAYAPEDAVEGQDEERLLSTGISPSFIKVLKFAQAQGCYLIRLDRDGDLYEDEPALDRHDW